MTSKASMCLPMPACGASCSLLLRSRALRSPPGCRTRGRPSCRPLTVQTLGRRDAILRMERVLFLGDRREFARVLVGARLRARLSLFHGEEHRRDVVLAAAAVRGLDQRSRRALEVGAVPTEDLFDVAGSRPSTRDRRCRSDRRRPAARRRRTCRRRRRDRCRARA